MRRPALSPRLKARPRLRRAVIALVATLGALLPFAVTGISPAAAVSAGGAPATRWVREANIAEDWYGGWLGGNYNPRAGQGDAIYGVDTSWNDHPGRIRFTRYFVGVGGFLYAGNGYHCMQTPCDDYTGGNGLWPRTMPIQNPDDPGGPWISNKTFLENSCDYYGIAFSGGFNVGAQSYQASDKTNPWYGHGGTPYSAAGSWWYWASPWYTRDDDRAGNGNTWAGPAGPGWYYACERNYTDRLLAYDSQPDGGYDSAVNTAPGAVQVQGWAADRDRFAATTVTVTVDGATKLNAAPTTVTRADASTAMNNAYDGSKRFTDAYGYNYTLTGLTTGTHSVCVTANDALPSDSPIDGGSAGNKSLGCKSVLVDRAPVAADDTATTWLTTPVTVDVLANDTDPDNDKLTVQSAGAGKYGTTAIVGGKVVYTPKGTAGDVWDSFTYTAADPWGMTDSATVQVWIDRHYGVNPGPKVGTDTVGVYMGAATPIPVLANDTVPAGLKGTSTVTFGGMLTLPAHGALTVNAATGVLGYTPTSHFTGTDSFTYSSCLNNVNYSPEQQCAAGTVNVTVINRPPTAEDFSVTANPGQTITVPFAAHVADPDGDAVGVNVVSQPAVSADGLGVHWDATANSGAGGFVYTAPRGVTPGGKTTFTYAAFDSFGGVSATHTVTINLPYVVRPS